MFGKYCPSVCSNNHIEAVYQNPRKLIFGPKWQRGEDNRKIVAYFVELTEEVENFVETKSAMDVRR